jgi:hypothetical protein
VETARTGTAIASQDVVLEARDSAERISPVSVSSWALYDFANTKCQLL